ncbi:hypothetical protein IFM89_020938 [Coptis chinensis]|uniref:Endonuclease/exonuclease/phosphatase domain-containing protein n=1 Tax=Coptis chinensis TaxID=261450 RepID=A0A835MF22_9MAGN|nr:hypothetical protein IFM89_020938 [Coptis chinensis]
MRNGAVVSGSVGSQSRISWQGWKVRGPNGLKVVEEKKGKRRHKKKAPHVDPKVSWIPKPTVTVSENLTAVNRFQALAVEVEHDNANTLEGQTENKRSSQVAECSNARELALMVHLGVVDAPRPVVDAPSYVVEDLSSVALHHNDPSVTEAPQVIGREEVGPTESDELALARRAKVNEEADHILHLASLQAGMPNQDAEPPDPHKVSEFFALSWADMIDSDQQEASTGISNEKTINRLSKLIKDHDPDFIGIAAPLVDPNQFHLHFFTNLGYSASLHVNQHPSHCQNILFLWKSNIPAPNLIVQSPQQITVEVNGCLITIVHAYSLYTGRRQLWRELTLINQSNLPWLLIGDFNTYLSPTEKRGGLCPSNRAMTEFREVLNHNMMLEAPNKGYHFTWCNRQLGSSRTWGKLDRAFMNIAWKISRALPRSTRPFTSTQGLVAAAAVLSDYSLHYNMIILLSVSQLVLEAANSTSRSKGKGKGPKDSND